ncbi:MAG: hypothetical protein Q7K26_01370 [bacterium]|nr:hypothetical protein [bacterium]
MNEMHNLLALSNSLEQSLADIVRLFTGTNVLQWLNAVDRYHQNPMIDKSATAARWLELARQQKLKVEFNSLHDLIVTEI